MLVTTRTAPSEPAKNTFDGPPVNCAAARRAPAGAAPAPVIATGCQGSGRGPKAKPTCQIRPSSPATYACTPVVAATATPPPGGARPAGPAGIVAQVPADVRQTEVSAPSAPTKTTPGMVDCRAAATTAPGGGEAGRGHPLRAAAGPHQAVVGGAVDRPVGAGEEDVQVTGRVGHRAHLAPGGARPAAPSRYTVMLELAELVTAATSPPWVPMTNAATLPSGCRAAPTPAFGGATAGAAERGDAGRRRQVEAPVLADGEAHDLRRRGLRGPYGVVPRSG